MFNILDETAKSKLKQQQQYTQQDNACCNSISPQQKCKQLIADKVKALTNEVCSTENLRDHLITLLGMLPTEMNDKQEEVIHFLLRQIK